jgi:hypothetical protein
VLRSSPVNGTVVMNPDGTVPTPGLEVFLEYSRGRRPDAPEKFGDFADVRGTPASTGHGIMVSGSGGRGVGPGGAPPPPADPWAREERAAPVPASEPQEVSHGDGYALDDQGRWTLSSFVPDELFRLQLRDIRGALASLQRALEQLEQNANPRLVLDVLVLSLPALAPGDKGG